MGWNVKADKVEGMTNRYRVVVERDSKTVLVAMVDLLDIAPVVEAVVGAGGGLVQKWLMNTLFSTKVGGDHA
jgi:hypothetical protein